MSLSLAIASLAAAGALLVLLRRQRTQLQLLQRERSTASFSSLHGPPGSGGAKAAALAAFSTTPGQPGRSPTAAERFKALTIANPWSEHAGYIQVCGCVACRRCCSLLWSTLSSVPGHVRLCNGSAPLGPLQVPLATPHSGIRPPPTADPGVSPPRSAPQPHQEHRSPSPASAMPSPERHLWQVAVQAADRGVDLTARRPRQKRLFRSRSEAPTTLSDAGAAPVEGEGPGQGRGQLPQRRGEADSNVDALQAGSRLVSLPGDSSMV